jgi:glutathione S-transferase
MPALKLGENSIYETSAILRYIDEVYPGPALLPADPLARAKAEQWISAFNAYLDKPFVRDYVLSYLFPSGPEGKPDRARIEGAVPAIRKGLAALEAAYADRDYLAGEALSLADIIIAPAIASVGLFPEGADLLGASPNVRRAHAAMAARESWRKVH